MATKLHYAVLRTKMFLRTGVFLILGGILLFFLLQLGISLKERYFPTPPPAPTVVFGKLPRLQFGENATSTKLTYTVDTLSGILPTFPTQTVVYKISKNTPSLLDLQKATNKASRIGFIGKPTALSQTQYQWTNDTETLSKKLVMDIVNPYLSLSSNYLSKAALAASQDLTSEEAIAEAENFFRTLALFPADIDTAKTKTSLKTIDDQSGIIRVDFFQKPVQDTTIYYVKPDMSTMYALVAKPSFTPDVVEAGFSYLPVGNEAATYPIKTAQEALDELQKGGGYIASYNSNATNVPIQNVTFGYYAGDTKQLFLMPIVVFEASGFKAYVSAIRNEWIQ